MARSTWSVRKKFAVTARPITRTGSPSPEMTPPIGSRAARFEKTLCCARQSRKFGKETDLCGDSLEVSAIAKSCSGCGNGSAFKSTPLTTLKMAVFAPIPRASVKIATTENTGFLINWRKAKRRFFTSFVTECNHWIDTGGATRGNKTGSSRNQGKHPGDCEINGRI